MPSIKKPLLKLSALFLLYSFHSNTYAGSDEYCQPSLNILGHQYDACNSLPILDPGNDNRVNMVLLLKDLQLAQVTALSGDEDLYQANYGIVPFEAETYLQHTQNLITNTRQSNASENLTGYEHCSNLVGGERSFIKVVENDASLSTAEKDALLKARLKIKDCYAKYPFLTIDKSTSLTYQQFASYLNGSIAFYNGNFATAEKIFAALTTASQPWVKETAQYMLIRSKLNKTYAAATNEYGDLNLDQLNKIELADFLNSITHYLKLYPNGTYAASARGLMRRAFWLLGRQDLLVQELVWQFNHPKSPYYNLEMQNLPAEIDRRIFASQYFNPQHFKDPFFLTIHNLMQMRSSSDSDQHVISWDALNAQKEYFKNQPELFRYLQAMHLFFIQNKATEALNLLPAKLHMNTAVGLSQIFLKGRILEKTNSQQAVAYWESQYKNSRTAEQKALFELALFHHYKKSHNYAAFIGTQAKISQLNLQYLYLDQYADLPSLNHIIQGNIATQLQKDIALNTLLSRTLLQSKYQELEKSLDYLPKDAAQYKASSKQTRYQKAPPLANYLWQGLQITPNLKCPNLKTLAGQLADQPNDLTLQLCLGEYMRSNDGSHLTLGYADQSYEPIQGLFSRGAVYRKIISTVPKGELHAYALYRSIQCYAPSGYNDCQDDEVPKSTRKQWFDQLKQQYPDTSWAKSLKYYW